MKNINSAVARLEDYELWDLDINNTGSLNRREEPEDYEEDDVFDGI